jgi:50S ribosomal protein L16 3-hydroxylase
MDVDTPLALLAGLSPAQFMRRHWQKRPLLVRQAWPGVLPPLPRRELFALAASDAVESRLVVREGRRWQLQRGPLARRVLPPISQPRWTLLVQGLDLHVAAAHDLLRAFRFVPDARLDDLMVSWASDGGGVGPHLDSYDVFLLQVQGRRRWRVGPVAEPRWVPGAPLKLLRGFVPASDWVLEPGDMLYVPPGWGHDGVAVGGDCMTCSVGFRAPARSELASELLQRLADELEPGSPLYRDPRQPAVAEPAAVPADLVAFAAAAVQRQLADPRALRICLGEWLSEPKPQVSFDGPGRVRSRRGGISLSPRTRMLYDGALIFINGEALQARGGDLALLHRLANERTLAAADVARLSDGARQQIDQWVRFGWADGT